MRRNGAVLGLVLHFAGRYPDTAMSVGITDPMPCTAVAVNLQQLRAVPSPRRPAAGPSTCDRWSCFCTPWKTA
ncbi:hypothetical protein [Streptomyces sp. NPDC057636]|uniref:hypothetical protein n=1 Tax=Streptomyces sp. NPDC057636 TaxID=3346189 RepID=UPI003696FFB1